jgi:hypothetical protein
MNRRKECPACRCPCLTKRNLRLDPRFDSIIQLFHPQLELEKQQEESLLVLSPCSSVDFSPSPTSPQNGK